MTATVSTRPARTVALLAISLGYFMILFDTTAVTVALPAVARELGGGTAGLAWVADGYTLTFAGCLLAGGIAADRLGAARVFEWALAAFGLLSLGCAAAPSIASLVAARALLGISGALVLPASLSLLAALYPTADERRRAVSTWASVSGLALAAGPLLGGGLVAGFGWRAVFLVNAPVAAVAIAAVASRHPPTPRRNERVAWSGQLAVVVAVAALSWALIRGGEITFARLDVLGALALAVLAAVAGARIARRATNPAVPRALLAARAARGALAAGFAVGGAFAGELFVQTLALQQARGLGPVLTGLAFLPLTVPMIAGPPLASAVLGRLGPTRPVLAGLLAIAAAAGGLAAVPDTASYALTAAALTLLGCGLALTLPALTGAVVAAAPAGTAGAAGGLFSVVRQTGATVGVAAVTAVAGPRVAGAARAELLIAAVTLLAALGWAAASRPPRPQRRPGPGPAGRSAG